MAKYEYAATAHKYKKGQNPKTVDFKIYANKPRNASLLIELSSLRESGQQKKKAWINDDYFGYTLNASDEATDYFKAQKVLIEKAEKFSLSNSNNQSNAIILDMRSVIPKCIDSDDYKNILFGSEKLNPFVQRYTKDKMLFPGIFCQSHPANSDRGLDHLRKTIHCFGFVAEKTYTEDELAMKIEWFANPDINETNIQNIKDILGCVRME